MREVRIDSYCDACLHAATPVEGGPRRQPAEHTLLASLRGQPARELDLCDDCAQRVVGELALLLQDVGRAPEGQTPAQAKRSHRRAAGQTASAAAGATGGAPAAAPAVPAPTATTPSQALPYACIACELRSFSWSGLQQHLRNKHGLPVSAAFGTRCPLCDAVVQVLGGHGLKAHGAANVHDLFALAEAAGDPHGVVAARRAEHRAEGAVRPADGSGQGELLTVAS